MNKNDDDNLGVEYEKLIEDDTFEFVRDYFPHQDNIKQKGRLERDLPILLSTVEMFPDLFEELQGFEELLDKWIYHIEQRKISVEGESRKEFEKILSSVIARANMNNDDQSSSSGYKDYFKSKSRD